MSDLTKSSDQEMKDKHVKKHDHSALGKHTKEEKQRYLEGSKKQKKIKTDDISEIEKKHVKKHDHSVLGKHTREDKLKYLETSKNTKEIGGDGHIKKDNHSFLGKHTKEEKQNYLDSLLDKASELEKDFAEEEDEPIKIETNPDLAVKKAAITNKRPVKRRRRRRLF